MVLDARVAVNGERGLSPDQEASLTWSACASSSITHDARVDEMQSPSRARVMPM